MYVMQDIMHTDLVFRLFCSFLNGLLRLSHCLFPRFLLILLKVIVLKGGRKNVDLNPTSLLSDVVIEEGAVADVAVFLVAMWGAAPSS